MQYGVYPPPPTYLGFRPVVEQQQQQPQSTTLIQSRHNIDTTIEE
jgi:hypothetical protein